jgi:hypothetical protein
MKKEEKILREILMGTMEKRERFYQKEISKTCKVSIGLVNKVINKLEGQGSLQRKTKGFSVIDPNKILMYWSTKRNLNGEVSEKHYIKKSVTEIEKTLPNCVIFTAYSGWKLLTERTPADYREIYVYVPIEKKELMQVWLKENKPSKGPENLFVIYTDDEHLIKNSRKNIAPVPQIFVDVYSLTGISGKYFLKDMMEVYPVFELV